jgi:hypothetical protein
VVNPPVVPPPIPTPAPPTPLAIVQAGGLLVLGGPDGAGVPVFVRITSRSAALSSEVGFFVVDASGRRIARHVVFRNGRAVGSAIVLNLLAGQRLLFYIKPQGSSFLFTALAKDNPDKVNHVRIKPLGASRFRLSWEDTLGGGDRDFNDVVFDVSLAS